MAVTIYGAALSPFVARVILACDYKGVPFELTMPKDGIKSPAFLKINPFGKMPAIKDGKNVVIESGVIVDYIDAKYKKKKLVPAAAKAAAHARLIAAVAAEYVQPHGLTIFRTVRAKTATAESTEAAKAEMAKGLDVLEQLISGKKFAAGSSATIADCFAIPALFFAVEVGKMVGVNDMIGPRRKLAAYWKSANANKISAKTLKAMGDRLKQILAGG